MPSSRLPLGLAALSTLLVVTACERDIDSLGLAPFPNEPRVFVDGLAPNVDFQPFAGAKTDALTLDPLERRSGTSSIRARVPLPSDPSGSYAGGAFIATVPRDLTAYNALTFWARASVPITLNTAGLGNDNTGTSRFSAEVDGGLPVSTGWTKLTLPIPDPSFLSQEGGLFFFAEGAEGSAAYDIWFDDIQFESLGTLANPRPTIPTETRIGTVGTTLGITGTQYTVDVSGADVTMNASPAYFAFSSSDPSVATVDEDGIISFLASGTATITATLGGTAAVGVITVQAEGPPTEAAPVPTVPADSAISIFSNAYTDVPVNSFAVFNNAGVSDEQIAGDDVKLYTNLGGTFEGIEFTTPTIDATDATRFRMDIWTPDATALPAVFRVKLVDFGADGAFGGGDDSEHELVFTANTTPGLVTRDWVSIDVPMSDFAGLASQANLAQIILSGDLSTVYVDNIFFYDDGEDTTPPPPTDPIPPTAPAPNPTPSPANVISIYSDSYTDNPNQGFNLYGAAAFEEVDVASSGNSALKYTRVDVQNGNFQLIELGGDQIDATGMTNFRFDAYFPNPQVGTEQFLLKLVDIGTTTTEAQIFVNSASNPALSQGSWLSFDFPLDELIAVGGSDPINTGNIQQIVIDLLSATDVGEVYLDNIFFYDADAGPPGPIPPAAPAPEPTEGASDVISIYSDSYTNNPNQGFNLYGAAAFEEVDIASSGNSALKYTRTDVGGGNFTVIELGGDQIDATGMTNFRFDVYFPNPQVGTEQFLLKLVDIGAATTEELFFINSSSNPMIAQGTWLSFDYELATLTGLGGTANIQQVVIDLLADTDVGEAYIDNIYFYR